MKANKTILLKLTGEILAYKNGSIHNDLVKSIAKQIKSLNTYYFGIVIVGGNFFRGNKQGFDLGLSKAVGHQIGMLATMMNGLIVKDLFEQHGIPSTLFSALPASEIGLPISLQTIQNAREQ